MRWFEIKTKICFIVFNIFQRVTHQLKVILINNSNNKKVIVKHGNYTGTVVWIELEMNMAGNLKN